MVLANDYIDVQALWKVLVIGLAAGAGVVALFATGLVAVSYYEGTQAGEDGRRGSPAALVGAGLCFLGCLALVGYGISVMFDK